MNQTTAIESSPRAESVDRALRLRRFLDGGLVWLRACAKCGSQKAPVPLFCESCERLERKLRSPLVRREGYPFSVETLYVWTDESDPHLRPLVYGFKDGWAAEAAREWAEALSHHVKAPPYPVRFVYPSKGARDHAWLLAATLAEVWEAPPPLALLAESKGRQHEKRVGERALRRLIAPPGEKISSPISWIFVDDVITSGSTALAAYMALGDPDCFRVWALVTRPKLAGK